MEIPKPFLISLSLNFIFILLFLSLSCIYRDKLLQGFVSAKGDPEIVMFGNSIMAQGKWVELLGRTDVLTSALPGQSTYHFLQLIHNRVIDLHPKICILEGGINDITVGVCPEKLQSNYRKILEQIASEGIIPVVTLTLYEQNDPSSKAEVKILNGFLKNYCRKHGIDYIDLNQYLSDSTGLKAEFAVDKTHLNVKAYKIWAREIDKILKKNDV